MIIPPLSQEEAKNLSTTKGPNIKECPKASSVENQICAKVVLKTSDNITTDHIMPAGSKILPLRSNIPEIAKHVYEAVDPDFYKNAKELGTSIIIGGENYGQGSSREHAAIAPMYLGIKAVIAKSFARIHKANLVNFGIIPLTFSDPSDYDKIDQLDEIELVDVVDALQNAKQIKAINKTKGTSFYLNHDLQDRAVAIMIAGGTLNYVKERWC